MRHLRTILFVLLILALATVACGLDLGKIGRAGQGPQATEAPAPEAQPPAATEAPSGEAEPPPTAAPEQPPATVAASQEPAEGAEGDTEEAELDLGTSMSGLENLNSYRAAFRFDWNGTKGGQPVTGFMEMRSAFVREPPAQELHFEGQGFEGGQDQGLGKVSFIQIGDTAWFYEGESDSWMQVPAGSLDFAEGLFFQPQDLLKDFDVSKGRRSLLPKEVNGVPCYIYTFDEKGFDLSNLAEGDKVMRAEGEVCVAVDGGYVVQLMADADFRYADPEEVFEEGNVKVSFDISDVNQPITIEPPAEAKAQGAGRDDMPMLPDADVEFAGAEFTTYRTASSVEAAAQFYQAEMPKNGWTAEEDNLIMAETALLNYNKGADTASIIIGTDENGTNVVITITQQ